MFTIGEYLGIGECNLCNTFTKNKIYSKWSKKDIFCCKKCQDKINNSKRGEYGLRFDRAIKRMKNNGYYSIAEGWFDEGIKETRRFEITNHHMSCVDEVRKIMKEQGYKERYFGFHYEKHFGLELEIVDYLWFSKFGDGFDDDGDREIIHENAFWFYLKGDKRIKNAKNNT